MQGHIWEREYRSPQLVSLSVEAIRSVRDFTRWIRRDQKVEIAGKKILDLGCGNGKNSIYMAEQGFDNEIVGIDVSETALRHARDLADQKKEKAQFINQSIGSAFPFADNYFDITLDSTSSNSLTESEREVYIKELHRTLNSGGYVFVRTLCKDGDENAKILLKESPGKEKDTYIMPELGLTERVFTESDLLALYSPLFEILFLEKETHYTKFKGQSYKRNFWVAYLRKN